MVETVLLTGAAGFIPSHIADVLVDRGFRVLGVDDFSQGSETNLDHVRSNPRFEFFEGDIRNQELMRSLLQRSEYVVHAAVRGLASSVQDPLIDLDVNTRATLALLQLSVERGVRRFVYASSASVYGNPSRIPESEFDCVGPLSPYAVSKLAGEQYSLVYHRLYGLPVVCLRYFNTYGPRQNVHSIYGGVVSIFIHRALGGEPLVVFGDGEQTRDFAYVEDIARATADAVVAKNVEGTVLNLGSGVETSVTALAKEVLSLINPVSSENTAHSIVYDSARLVDNIPRRCADTTRAAELLGYHPQYGLEKGLLKTIEWYRAQSAIHDRDLKP